MKRAARSLRPLPPEGLEPSAFRPVVANLSGHDDLAALSPALARVIAADFDLAALEGQLCPALLEDGSAAVFAVQDQALTDAAAELLRQLRGRGLALAEPSIYVLPAPLLLALSRGQITAASLRSRRALHADPRRTALARAFDEIVAWGLRHGASDIHLNVSLRQRQSQVRYTVAGRYVAPECYARMPTATLMEILSVAWMQVRGGNGAVFDPSIEQQGQIWHRAGPAPAGVMLRWASLAADAGPSVCLRIIRLDGESAATGIAELGYLPGQAQALARAGRCEGGAVVLAGAVGSGKSTTLAALMRAVPATRKVVTLEDPVEYLIPGALQNTVGRDLQDDGQTVFDAKLRTLKRSAMNDLMIGEIRDAQTGRAFMDLAASGVSVYTTTHAGSVLLIGERLASDFIGISRDFLATPGILKLLVYQALLPALCAHCALPLESLFEGPGAAACRRWAERIETAFALDPLRMKVRNPQGCAACRSDRLPDMAGLSGRTVAAEMFEPEDDPVFLRCLRERDNLGLLRHFAGQRGAAFDEPDMRGKTAMQCALYKASQGWVDPRDVEARFRPFDSVAPAGRPA
ncbi:ATPase, T2SS/T4P/T4SS family [Orrella sp. JC864]|uniref:ATPase, T2SS/T4P/T4SS family n=1 Tax=Orrella sp. JC864 TaxID=3120298 RepID=UPI003008B7A4